MHAIEHIELSPAGITMLQVVREVTRFFSGRFTVQKSHQVFSSMTNWSLIYVLHTTSSPDKSGF